MFLSEMVRHVADEDNSINESTAYSRASAAWGTIHDYGAVNPATAGIYALSYQVRAMAVEGEFRVKVGSRYIHGSMNDDATYTTHSTLVYLPTGSQDVIVENKMDGGATGWVRNFQLGRAEFSDVDGEVLQTYTGALTMNLVSRSLPIGTINKAILIVNCWAYTSAAQTNFENIGDSLTNGVSLTIEGSQVDWTTREQDPDSDENAWAEYYGVEDLDEDITVTITKDNANTVVHITVIFCPWILTDLTTNEPVTLVFSQGSTLYVMTEPLHGNPTVNIKIGKPRAVSFGDTTDYYSTASGTGILQHNYTFEEVKADQVKLFIYGRGACISSIGVDRR